MFRPYFCYHISLQSPLYTQGGLVPGVPSTNLNLGMPHPKAPYVKVPCRNEAAGYLHMTYIGTLLYFKSFGNDFDYKITLFCIV